MQILKIGLFTMLAFGMFGNNRASHRLHIGGTPGQISITLTKLAEPVKCKPIISMDDKMDPMEALTESLKAVILFRPSFIEGRNTIIALLQKNDKAAIRHAALKAECHSDIYEAALNCLQKQLDNRKRELQKF